MIKHAIALALLSALLSAPLAATAQTAPAPGAVTVEIVAAGQVTVPAQIFRMSITVSGKGADEAAAGVALAANRAKLVQALARQGVIEAKTVTKGPTLSIANLISSVGNRKRPTFSPSLEDGADGETSGSEKVTFDAPSRAAVTSATAAAVAQEAVVDEDVLVLLKDYVAPTRQAKADALKKAQAEADAYAASLGMRRATLTKVSEKQDIVGGSLGFIAQLFSLIGGGKGVEQSETVDVQASLTVEFQLTR